MTKISDWLPALFLISAVSWALIYFIKIQNRKKLMALVRASSRLSRNEVPSLPSWYSNDWNTLANAVTHMAHALQNKVVKSEKEREKLATILSHMQEGVIAVDRNFQILIFNPSAAHILGFKDIAIGKGLLEYTRNPEIDEMVRWAVTHQQAADKNLTLTYPVKKHLRVSAGATGQSETGICGLVVLYDVTEIRNLEKIRQEFVANVSHELRTPLTSITGFIETMLSGSPKDPAQSEKFLKIMQEDANRLARLIDDLLDLSVMESKVSVLKPVKINLHEEIEKALLSLQPAVKKRNIEVVLDFDKNISEISADRDRLKQVFVNLIDNAIKFNKDGGKITLKTALLKDSLEITVQDTGLGIPPQDLPRIFERFYRVDKMRSKDSGGTGLGLSIVKHILEAHSGTIICESKPGQGSTFRVFLPL